MEIFLEICDGNLPYLVSVNLILFMPLMFLIKGVSHVLINPPPEILDILLPFP